MGRLYLFSPLFTNDKIREIDSPQGAFLFPFGSVWKRIFYERKIEGLDLTNEQKRVLQAVRNKQNVFITGLFYCTYNFLMIMNRFRRDRKKLPPLSYTGSLNSSKFKICFHSNDWNRCFKYWFRKFSKIL